MRPIFGSKWDNLIYLLVSPLRTQLSVKEVEEECLPEMARDFTFEPTFLGSLQSPQIFFISVFLSKACSRCLFVFQLYTFIARAASFCMGAFNSVFLRSVRDSFIHSCTGFTHFSRKICSSKFTHCFCKFFETENPNPQTFLLFGCMTGALSKSNLHICIQFTTVQKDFANGKDIEEFSAQVSSPYFSDFSSPPLTGTVPQVPPQHSTHTALPQTYLSKLQNVFL